MRPAWPSRRTLRVTAALAFVGLLVFGIAMRRAEAVLEPNSIIVFEFAFEPEDAQAILDAWGDAGRAAARRTLLLDVGFILLGYVPLLASLCLLLAREADTRRRTVGRWLAAGVLLAGALDLIENAALGGVLARWSDPPAVLTWTAGIAATIKFLLAIAAVVYVVVGLRGPLSDVTPLVQWFLSYPVLVLVATLVVLVVWRLFLTSAGIPDLFWDEERFMQFLAGAGVGALLSHVGLMGFLLDTRRTAQAVDEKDREQWQASIRAEWLQKRLPWLADGPALLSGYLLRTSVPLLLLTLAGALRAPGGVPPWWLPLGAIVSFLLYSAGSVWIADERAPRIWTDRAMARQIDQADPAFRNLHRLAGIFVVVQVGLFLFLCGLYSAFERGVSVALAVCILLAGIASVYGFLKFFFAGETFGLLTLLVVAFVALNSFGGHHLRDLDYYRRVPVSQWTRLPPEPLLQSAEHLDAWKRARGVALPPLVVVAVDGGGIRAAVWTAVVMAQLERDVPSFPYYVRVVTGASGGMVGAASYFGSLAPPSSVDRHRDLEGRPVGLAELVRRVAIDSLGTLTRELVFKDLTTPPFLHPISDRGLALERAWEQNTKMLDRPFGELAAGEAEGWRPSLIVSPFIVEDGRRLLISNLDLGHLTRIPAAPPSRQAVEYFRMIEPHPGKLRLSTAVRLNASFPYVSPAAELPTHPRRHVLDAGYYDEHGVELAGTWIWTHREWLEGNTSGVLLVQVPDARARQRKAEATVNRQDWWGAGLVGLTSPVQALRTSQSASADYRNDQLVRFLREGLKPGFFETTVFEPDETSAAAPPPRCARSWVRELVGGDEPAFGEIALSWHLTSCEVSRLKEAIRGGPLSRSCADRRQFQDWWNAHQPASEASLSVQCPPAPLED